MIGCIEYVLEVMKLLMILFKTRLLTLMHKCGSHSKKCATYLLFDLFFTIYSLLPVFAFFLMYF